MTTSEVRGPSAATLLLRGPLGMWQCQSLPDLSTNTCTSHTGTAETHNSNIQAGHVTSDCVQKNKVFPKELTSCSCGYVNLKYRLVTWLIFSTLAQRKNRLSKKVNGRKQDIEGEYRLCQQTGRCQSSIPKQQHGDRQRTKLLEAPAGTLLYIYI